MLHSKLLRQEFHTVGTDDPIRIAIPVAGMWVPAWIHEEREARRWVRRGLGPSLGEIEQRLLTYLSHPRRDPDLTLRDCMVLMGGATAAKWGFREFRQEGEPISIELVCWSFITGVGRVIQAAPHIAALAGLAPASDLPASEFPAWLIARYNAWSGEIRELPPDSRRFLAVRRQLAEITAGGGLKIDRDEHLQILRGIVYANAGEKYVGEGASPDELRRVQGKRDERLPDSHLQHWSSIYRQLAEAEGLFPWKYTEKGIALNREALMPTIDAALPSPQRARTDQRSLEWLTQSGDEENSLGGGLGLPATQPLPDELAEVEELRGLLEGIPVICDALDFLCRAAPPTQPEVRIDPAWSEAAIEVIRAHRDDRAFVAAVTFLYGVGTRQELAERFEVTEKAIRVRLPLAIEALGRAGAVKVRKTAS